ncbi:Bardet-Biedl syndrome 10 protein isoform X2 [Protopterus annectens]|nr:Bardet-Biedl syndrome 10 protein isoform X2 [Protopterus annectens]
MQSICTVEIGTVLRVTEILENIVCKCFGPKGGQVLFTKATGEILITRDGRTILESLLLDHPIARVIVKCISTHCNMTGDGAKSFILLLCSFLRRLKTLADKECGFSTSENIPDKRRWQNHGHFLKRFSCNLYAFQAQVLDHLIAQQVRQYSSSAFSQINGKSYICHRTLEAVLDAYFFGSIGQINNIFMTKLTSDFFFRCTESSENYTDILDFIIDHFFEFHTAVSGLPIGCSKVLEGLVLHRDFAVFCPTDGTVRIIVVSASISPSLSVSDSTFVICSDSQLHSSQVWITVRVKEVMTFLQNNSVNLILSSVKQSETVHYFAKLCNISLVECLSDGEISLFCCITGISAFASIEDIIQSEIVTVTATAAFYKPLVLGAHRYVHLHLLSIKDFKPHCVVIYGPVQGLTEQYVVALVGALKVLKHLLKPVNSGCSLAEIKDKAMILPKDVANSCTAVLNEDDVNTVDASVKIERQCMDITECVVDTIHETQGPEDYPQTVTEGAVSNVPEVNSSTLSPYEERRVACLLQTCACCSTVQLHHKSNDAAELSRTKLDGYSIEMQEFEEQDSTTAAVDNSSSTVPCKKLSVTRNCERKCDEGNHTCNLVHKNNFQVANSLIEAGSVLPAGGTFEFLLHYTIMNYANKCHNPAINNVCSVIADGLLNIPRHIYCSQKGNRNLLHKLTKTLDNIKLCRPLTVDNDCLESVSCKYQLLLSVIQCLMKLITIDAVVAIKKKLQTVTDCENQ